MTQPEAFVTQTGDQCGDHVCGLWCAQPRRVVLLRVLRLLPGMDRADPTHPDPTDPADPDPADPDPADPTPTFWHRAAARGAARVRAGGRRPGVRRRGAAGTRSGRGRAGTRSDVRGAAADQGGRRLARAGAGGRGVPGPAGPRRAPARRADAPGAAGGARGGRRGVQAGQEHPGQRAAADAPSARWTPTSSPRCRPWCGTASEPGVTRVRANRPDGAGAGGRRRCRSRRCRHWSRSSGDAAVPAACSRSRSGCRTACCAPGCAWSTRRAWAVSTPRTGSSRSARSRPPRRCSSSPTPRRS